MKNYLSKQAVLTGDSTLVFTLNKEAKDKQLKGSKVINATVGTFLDKKSQVVSLPLIDKLQNEVMNNDSKSYASINGGDLYNKNIISWIFQDRLSNAKEKYKIASVASLGGTGALFLAFRNYIENDQNILLPDIGWTNYISIALNVGKNYLSYQLFDENGNFNINGILETAEKEAKTHGRVTLLINDPAHNPTGYSINKDEWASLINGLNKINETYPVVLILDTAYIDYAKDSRNYFDVINNISMNFVTLIAASLSKTLGLYGYRLGALIYVSKVDEVDEFLLANKLTVRSTWSNPNHYAINLFNLLMSKKEYIDELKLFLNKQIKILDERKEIVLKDLASILGGNNFVYHDGFFITYKHDNANEFSEKLKNENNIYVLPLKDKYLRFAICSFIDY